MEKNKIMKKLLLIFLCLPIISLAQQTYVPDDNFEQELIYQGYDNVLDNYVITANINTLTNLDVFNRNISDLTGIEDFTALMGLACGSNNLTSLNVSNNTALTNLQCGGQPLTSLDVSQNTALTNLDCRNNQLASLDVSQNTALAYLKCHQNQLTSLDVSNNTALVWLWSSNNDLTSLNLDNNLLLNDLYCRNNKLTSLDVSNNIDLHVLAFSYNDMTLTTVDVRNGNNSNIWYFDAISNPYLNCINVDDVAWADTNWTVANSNIDSTMYFSTNCATAFGCTDSSACNYDALATIDDSSCIWGPSSSSYDTLSVTTSVYTWNSITIITSGDYSDTLINSAGCDSIANLNLTITIPSGIFNISNTKRTLLKITDILGQETPYRRNQPLFYIYDDGTVEKRIVIE